MRADCLQVLRISATFAPRKKLEILHHPSVEVATYKVAQYLGKIDDKQGQPPGLRRQTEIERIGDGVGETA